MGSLLGFHRASELFGVSGAKRMAGISGRYDGRPDGNPIAVDAALRKDDDVLQVAGARRSLPPHQGPAGEGDDIRGEYRYQFDAVERWAHGGAPNQSQLFARISGTGWSERLLSRRQGSQERDACLAGLRSQVQVTVPTLVAYVAIVSNGMES